MSQGSTNADASQWLRDAVVERTGKGTLWQQIAQLLAESIQNGLLQPGEQLPTEHALADHFGVNRHTIRRAFAHLETSSLLKVERGRGTFVHENVINYALSNGICLSANLHNPDLEPSGVTLDMGERQATIAVARALKIPPNEPVIWIRKLSYADDHTVSISESSFSKHRFAGFLDIYQQRQSISATLAYFGIFDYTRKNMRVTARMPSSSEAELLKLPRNRPVLVTEAVNIDTDGIPIEYGRTAFHGEAVQLVMD